MTKNLLIHIIRPYYISSYSVLDNRVPMDCDRTAMSGEEPIREDYVGPTTRRKKMKNTGRSLLELPTMIGAIS